MDMNGADSASQNIIIITRPFWNINYDGVFSYYLAGLLQVGILSCYKMIKKGERERERRRNLKSVWTL